MVREENIEIASKGASIIPASTANSDYCSIVIIAQNNQPEPIYSEVTSLEINHELAITPQEAPKMVIDMIMAEANHSKKNKELTPPQEASVDIQKASQKAYNNVQCISAQRVPDPFRYVATLHEFLPDFEKASGPSQHL
ncbi:hypothetical protein O181_035908 [Austropuccinia psidii MF-1]|uniref:Uncharacterized protein n=1 Tax=Austropuccinia psidii MF-1 TaxID=1389203 RepID=A0A9Q3H8P6_9BASI|nr:hypothetical protein [Austropuccinia psidii MF-1]